ncbi:hypothetical protein SARC_00785 [Sphaeroforma arctica JP610]|uniref:Sister chromatid cohesion protein PDS5 n=1 Tax=Sphaeroforma arctica JP610 TaxID=667725 RepID=A0A0L0GDN5_9EUKA|nr:hypothetical protein SARC_00785 [Sphaeroforma arctica JP610]KNC87110.1 hypothetical protein SARC_00785 [Sphaeroforma arctica JP610]|eukprot:XP_014161012.1 hypothetical protein SARC_00785 [Sphaeroforma arctica JP610]
MARGAAAKSKGEATKVKAKAKPKSIAKTKPKAKAKATTKGIGKAVKITATTIKKRADKKGKGSAQSSASTQSEFDFKESPEESSQDSAVATIEGASVSVVTASLPTGNSKKKSWVLKEITGRISKDELLKRLKALLVDLQKQKQHETVSSEIAHFAETLVDTSLLKHKDKDVKIYVACCLAEVLRLYAPQTPYNDEVLVAVFRFFISQLRGLANHQSPYFTLAFSLLEVLAFVHSFVLCIELPEATELFCSLVSTLKETVSSNHSNKLVSYMADMVAGSLKEMDSIEPELLIAILESLLPDNKKENPIQFSLSRLILQKAETAMQGDLTRFFREILTGANKSRAELVHGGNVYALLGEISDIAPNAILYVYPLLKQMLEVNYDPQIKDEKQQKRYQATQLLCRMFCRDSTMIETHRGLWEQLLQRLKDIEPAIRAEVVAHCSQFVTRHPRHASDIVNRIGERVLDPAESVRMGTVQAVCSTAMANPSVVSKEVFERLCCRSKDKKPEVRDLAIKQIGEVYKTLLLCHAGETLNSAGMIGSHERELFAVYGAIPEFVFTAYATSGASPIDSTQRVAETVIQNCLIDNKASAEERALQVLNMYMSLSETGIKAYTQLIKHKINLLGVVKKYCDLRIGLKKAEDREETDIKAKQLLDTIAKNLGGNVSTNFDKLLKIHKSKDLSLFKLILKAQQVSTTPEKRREILSDAVTKVKEKDVVKAIFSRTSLVIFSQDLVTHQLAILRALANEDTEFENVEFVTVCSFLKMLAQVSPVHFEAQPILENLIDFLKAESNEIVDAGLQLLALMGESLRHGNAKSLLESTHPLMHDMVLTGTPRQSKLAVRVWAAATVNPDAAFDELLSELTSPARLTFDHALICTTLSALSTIAVVAPRAFDVNSGPAVLFVVKDLLQNNRTAETGDTDHKEIDAKVLGVKLLVKRLIGMDARASIASEEEENKSVDAFKITNKLLRALIANKRFCRDPMSEEDDAKLRLVGASGYLKVAMCKSYKPLLPASQMDLLALTMEDPEESVREGFSKKLIRGLFSMKLDINFLALVPIAALDPNENLQKSARASYVKIVEKYKQISAQLKASGTNEQVLHRFRPELSLPVLLSVIAHREEDGSEEERIQSAVKILTFCLDVLTHHEKGSQGESYDYLHTIVARVKNCKDVLKEESEDLYVVCDLATLMITNCAHRNIKNWIIQPFPSKIKLPSGFFSMDRKAAANNQSYLPADFELGETKEKAVIKNSKAKTKAITPKSNLTKKVTKLAAANSMATKRKRIDSLTKAPQVKKEKIPVAASRRQAPRGAKPAIGTMKVHSKSESDEETDDNLTTKKDQRGKNVPDQSVVEYDESESEVDDETSPPKKKAKRVTNGKVKGNDKADLGAGFQWQPTLTSSATSHSQSPIEAEDGLLKSPHKPKAHGKVGAKAKSKAKPKHKAKKASALHPRKRKNQLEAKEDSEINSASDEETSESQYSKSPAKNISRKIEDEIDGDDSEDENVRGKALYDTAIEEKEIDIHAPRQMRSRPTLASSAQKVSSNKSSPKFLAKRLAKASVATTAAAEKAKANFTTTKSQAMRTSTLKVTEKAGGDHDASNTFDNDEGEKKTIQSLESEAKRSGHESHDRCECHKYNKSSTIVQCEQPLCDDKKTQSRTGC